MLTHRYARIYARDVYMHLILDQFDGLRICQIQGAFQVARNDKYPCSLLSQVFLTYGKPVYGSFQPLAALHPI